MNDHTDTKFTRLEKDKCSYFHTKAYTYIPKDKKLLADTYHDFEICLHDGTDTASLFPGDTKDAFKVIDKIIKALQEFRKTVAKHESLK